MKVCKKCERERPVEEFFVNRAMKDGRMSMCRDCSMEKTRAYRLKNLDRERAIGREKQRAFRAANPSYDRWMKIWRKYGLTPKQWEDLYSLQQGRCAICIAPLAEGTKICVDHDHATGVVRGLLCTICNQGLGYFKDDPDRLRRAAAYVEAAPVAVEQGEEVMPYGDCVQ